MRAQNRLQQTVDDLAARIQRSQGNVAIGGDDLERRRDGGYIPARISLGVFVTGRKIDAALGIELVEQPAQALFKRNFGKRAFDDDAAGGGITVGAHKIPLGSTPRISRDWYTDHFSSDRATDRSLISIPAPRASVPARHAAGFRAGFDRHVSAGDAADGAGLPHLRRGRAVHHGHVSGGIRAGPEPVRTHHRPIRTQAAAVREPGAVHCFFGRMRIRAVDPHHVVLPAAASHRRVRRIGDLPRHRSGSVPALGTAPHLFDADPGGGRFPGDRADARQLSADLVRMESGVRNADVDRHRLSGGDTLPAVRVAAPERTHPLAGGHHRVGVFEADQRQDVSGRVGGVRIQLRRNVRLHHQRSVRLHQPVQGPPGGVRLAVRSGGGRHGRSFADQRPDVASDADLARAAERESGPARRRACCCWPRC